MMRQPKNDVYLIIRGVSESRARRLVSGLRKFMDKNRPPRKANSGWAFGRAETGVKNPSFHSVSRLA